MTNRGWRNWSGSVSCDPVARSAPESETALAEIIARSPGPVRVSGAGHSFTAIVATDGTLLSLDKLSGLLSVDQARKTAWVQAGTRIRDLGPLLQAEGLALQNQGDIDRQSLAGAVGTGTHGTGAGLQSISAAVTGFRLIDGKGNIHLCDAQNNPDWLLAGSVSVGSLGVMSAIEIQCAPSYALEERGGRLSVDEVFDRLPEFRDNNRHFEFFWYPLADEVLIKTLNVAEAEPKPRRRRADGEDSPGDVYFRRLCDRARFIPWLKRSYQRHLTELGGAPFDPGSVGKTRWSHDAFPSERNVRFNEMEYAVPADAGPDCMRDVARFLRRSGINFLFPVEYRYVAADENWLSPFYGRASVTISVHQYHKQSHTKLFAGAEEIFRAYDGRPHWGKVHTLGADELSALYPKWEAFQAVRRAADPDRRFQTPYLENLLG